MSPEGELWGIIIAVVAVLVSIAALGVGISAINDGRKNAKIAETQINSLERKLSDRSPEEVKMVKQKDGAYEARADRVVNEGLTLTEKVTVVKNPGTDREVI